MNAQAPSLGNRAAPIFVAPPAMWIAFLCACGGLAAALEPSLRSLLAVWFQSEDLGYGPAIPVVSAFLIWQRRDQIDQSEFRGSWTGVVALLIATAMALIGQRAAVPALAHFGFVAALMGLTLATTGWGVVKKLLGAFCILLLAIPLPAFLFNTLSLDMQLLSSQIGVAIVRLFGVSVFLEGNVIDLGVYKLEVAEACNGLRYLFPLMTLGFLLAYFFKAAFWKRTLLFLSSIPIAILMNSLRIGVIGVLVDRWGTSMAEGFLHEFQGWSVFMVSVGVMIVEMLLLARLSGDRRPWRQIFGVEFPPPRSNQALRTPRPIEPQLIAATTIAIVAAALSLLLPQRSEAAPSREPLSLFPARVGDWTGKRSALDAVYLDALKLDDYIVADYRSDGRLPVNFYMAWYNSQRSGQSAHSPRSCLPGGGWHIDSLESVDVPLSANNASLSVNRVLISQGEQRQLTYYWFQQRGRVLTNEYLVKWYLFWDSLTRNRTDGAMVRLIVPLPPNVTLAEADASLTNFLQGMVHDLPRFVPN